MMRDLPNKNQPEQLLQEKAMFKVPEAPGTQQLQSGSHMGRHGSQGGIGMAISPSEETKLQMFTWSCIIFSLGFVSGHYKDFAGDVAASIAFTSDLNGEHSHNALDMEGLYMLNTAEVDDCGYWVRFQVLIPGIL
ncbi:clustered mitochondria protein homolog [Nomascus leucogenys]|uniref:clustered mitochondria protein homolog n=1 Tax=Nomascus leucogenys TaxID=61853 RepID=UPI00122DBDE5|nr:clustered mitochondria protein homolog [Nomascus leucogenys]XP_030653562.1 clustered mitochondria protein homolog [Nomascus leucogenys]